MIAMLLFDLLVHNTWHVNHKMYGKHVTAIWKETSKHKAVACHALVHSIICWCQSVHSAQSPLPVLIISIFAEVKSWFPNIHLEEWNTQVSRSVTGKSMFCVYSNYKCSLDKANACSMFPFLLPLLLLRTTKKWHLLRIDNLKRARVFYMQYK